MMKIRNFAAASVAILAIAAFGVAKYQGNPLEKYVGKPLPKFSMKTTDGKVLNNASIKGKVVFFDFWATWCGPCKAASPAVDAIAKKYKSKGLMVIGATVSDEPGNAKKYKAEHKYSYTFVDSADKLAEHYGITGIPAFFVVDKNGVIRKVFTGYGPGAEKEFEKAIVALLK